MSTHDERYNDPIHGVIRPSDIYGDAPSMSLPHASLVAELLQTRTVLQELWEAIDAVTNQPTINVYRLPRAMRAASVLLAVEPPKNQPDVLAVLRELTEAVQTPKSGRRFFLAFKAALDLLESECQPVTEGAQKP